MPNETPATVTVPFAMKLELLTNLIIGALEGGATYWLRSATYLTDTKAYESPAYAEVAFWQKGGRMTVFYDDPDNEERQAGFEIGLTELTNGATVMSEKYPSHFGDLISENDDATTSDVYIQCVIFKEIIYG